LHVLITTGKSLNLTALIDSPPRLEELRQQVLLFDLAIRSGSIR